MIEATYLQPDEKVSWLIKQFESIRTSGSLILEDKYIPRTDVGFVFHFGELPRITTPIEVGLKRAFLAPVVNKANTMKADGPLDTFVATCHPTIVTRLFDLNLSQATKLYLSLQTPDFTQLWEELNKRSTLNERAMVFSAFVESYQDKTYEFDEIDRCYFNIIQHCNDMAMEELLCSTKLSVSTLQRQFKKRLGISGKTLARIARLNHIWNMILENPNLSYQDMIYFGNYFDQSHLIHDFKGLTGETPGEFFSRNHEVTKLLSGR